MSQDFYSKKTVFGVPTALLLLMAVFFAVPFAARGARMALQKTENNVKDWLPSDFRETEELAWFAKRFVSEQFVVATWDGCSEDSQKLQLFVSKLNEERLPDDLPASSDRYRAKQLGAELALFVGEDLHFDWGGKEEKWLIDESGRSYYVTPNGRLYRWDGNPNLVSAAWRTFARATGSFQLEGQFMAAFGEPSTEDKPNQFWENPRLLTAPLLKSVETGPDVVKMLTVEGGALYNPSETEAGERQAMARLTGTLFGPPVPATFDWTPAALEEELDEATFATLPPDWKATWELVVEDNLKAKFDGEMQNLVAANPISQAEVWYDFFDAVGLDVPARQTCVKLTLTPEASRNQARVLGRGVLGQPRGRVFEIAEDSGVQSPAKPTMAPPPFSWLAQKAEVPEPVLRVGGPPVDNVAIDEEGTITLVRLIGYSLALGLVLSFICLKSVRLMSMVFFVGGTSAMASLSLVWWCNASIDAILLTMPSLVYVLGMAGAIHIVNYYRDAVREKGMKGAPERAISHALMPCTLAAFTTAIGLVSLCSSNILPIRKFGIFSAMGVMTTLVLLYIYLPSALTVFPPKSKTLKDDSNDTASSILKFWEAIGAFILRRHWYVNAVCFTAFIGLGLGLAKIQTSVQLLKLFDSQSQIIKDYGWLEDNFGRLVPMELVVRFPKSLQRDIDPTQSLSNEDLRNARKQMTLLDRADAVNRVQSVLQERFGYEGSNIVGQGMSPLTFLKDVPKPWQGWSPARATFNNILLGRREELLDSDFLAIESSQGNEGAELWRISIRLGALNDVDYGQFVNSLRNAVQPVVVSYRARQEIMQDVLDRHPGVTDGIKANVLFLGIDPEKSRKTVAESPSDLAVELSDAEKLELSDTRLLAESLADSLVNESIKAVIAHDPEKKPLDEEMRRSEKWGTYLSKFDSVVLVKPDEAYDIEFIRKSNANFVDAHGMLVSMREQAAKPRVAGGKAIELSEVDGEMDIVYTGIVPVVYKAQRTLLESLIQSVAWAFALIAFVMACLLSPARSFFGAFLPRNLAQSIGSGAVSMIPNVFPVVIIFGIMGHAGTLVDIGSMMTASVAMGVAVDDTIHFLTWFRDGLRRGLDRRDAIFVAYKHVAPAMTQTTIIGGLGLSVFALSTFTPTQRFGTLMLALLCAALVGDLIFLPALLASPLGRIFSMKATRKESGSDGQASDEVDEYQLADEPVESPEASTKPEIIGTPGESAVPAPKLLRHDKSHARRR